MAGSSLKVHAAPLHACGLRPPVHTRACSDSARTNRLPPQIPRLYNVYKEQGIIENFEQVRWAV